MQDKVTISEAANLLGISKKTLDRWDRLKICEPYFEELSKTRFYLKSDLEKLKNYWILRKIHKDHISRLEPIRKEIDKFIVTTTLSNPLKIQSFENTNLMKDAFDKMTKWEEEHKKIIKEYSEYKNLIYRFDKTI